MPLYDYRCSSCDGYFTAIVPLANYREVQVCPSCGDKNGKRIIRSVVKCLVGGNGSDRDIKSMQKSFREHFMKHELDDVRHKHGTAIDDSLRQGELRRRANGDGQ